MKRDTKWRILAAVIVGINVTHLEWLFCHWPLWFLFAVNPVVLVVVFLLEEWRASRKQQTSNTSQVGEGEQSQDQMAEQVPAGASVYSVLRGTDGEENTVASFFCVRDNQLLSLDDQLAFLLHGTVTYSVELQEDGRGVVCDTPESVVSQMATVLWKDTNAYTHVPL